MRCAYPAYGDVGGLICRVDKRSASTVRQTCGLGTQTEVLEAVEIVDAVDVEPLATRQRGGDVAQAEPGVIVHDVGGRVQGDGDAHAARVQAFDHPREGVQLEEAEIELDD